MTETKPFTGSSQKIDDSHVQGAAGKSNSSMAAPVATRQTEDHAKLGINLIAERVVGNLNFGNRSKNEGSTYKGIKTSSEANKVTTPMGPEGSTNSDKDTLRFQEFLGNISVGHDAENKGSKYEA